MTGKLKKQLLVTILKKVTCISGEIQQHEYLPLASGNFDWLIRLYFIKVTTSCDYNIHTSGVQSLYYHANI